MKKLHKEELVEKERQLASYGEEDSVVSSHEFAEILKREKTADVKVMSRFPDLDHYTDGFEGGELIIISGPPKSGKTLLAQTFTVNFVKQKVHSLWFTYEVMPRQFLARFPGPLPLFYLPRVHKPNMIRWLSERIWEAKLKYEVKAVFIDHLHYLLDIAIHRNLSLTIGTIIRELKQTAIDLNVVIFLLCHMTKIPERGKPSAHTIRDSSFVTQESDTTLVLYRIKDNLSKKVFDEAVLLVEMSRRTGCLHKKVRLIKANGLLQEVNINPKVDDERTQTD